MKNKWLLLLPNLILILIALVNLGRVIWNIPIIIGTYFFPGWTGALVFFVLGLISIYSFQSYRVFLRRPDIIVETEHNQSPLNESKDLNP